MARRILIAGNWKMNGSLKDLDFFRELNAMTGRVDAEILVCPPFPLISSALVAAEGFDIAIGAQDCHAQTAGAHTGDVSAVLLAELGARYVIVGHSERRADHSEGDALVRDKAQAAMNAGLIPIICVGESLEERDAGQADAVVTAQVKASIPDAVAGAGEIVIAYEPVWAIGTGKTAQTSDIEAMHAVIRSVLPAGETVRILYGGSVKPGNAAEIMALDNVDGALIGGASLTARSFGEVIKNTVI